MNKRLLVLATIGMAAAVSSIPTMASAQRFGGYNQSEYRGYYDDDDRRDAWVAHERREQRHRWQQEQARRRYWQHERWEHERARRYWDGDRWAHRYHDDDD